MTGWPTWEIPVVMWQWRDHYVRNCKKAKSTVRMHGNESFKIIELFYFSSISWGQSTPRADIIKWPALTLSWPQMGFNMAPLSYHLGFRIHWNDLVWFWTSFWTWPQAFFILENYFELSWRDCIRHNLFIYYTVLENRFEILDF